MISAERVGETVKDMEVENYITPSQGGMSLFLTAGARCVQSTLADSPLWYTVKVMEKIIPPSPPARSKRIAQVTMDRLADDVHHPRSVEAAVASSNVA